MTLANPFALLWGLLGIPIVILYLRRIRLRREPVATNMIWEQVFAAERARQAWQRWRHSVSLAVELVILVMIVVALAEPQFSRPRRLVLIIDNSASMNAADVKPTRLGEAKQAAGRLVAGLRPCDRAAVLSAGGAVGVHCTLTNDRATLQQAIESIPETQRTTQVDAAVELARRMLLEDASGELAWMLYQNHPGGKIMLLSDGCFDRPVQPVVPNDVEMIRIGKPTGNLAVTRLAARRNVGDPSKCQILAEVSNFSEQPAECRLELKLDGKPLDGLTVVVEANDRWQHVFEATAPGAGQVTANVHFDDVCPNDNKAATRVPAAADVQPDDLPEVALLAAEWAGWREGNLLRTVDDPGTEAAEITARRRNALPPWLYLIGVGVVLLVIQWRLYQRRWIS